MNEMINPMIKQYRKYIHHSFNSFDANYHKFYLSKIYV